MKNIPLILFCLLALASCNTKTGQAPEVGEVDTLAIASDTTTQRNIELNYEFAKSLPINQNLVLDIVGYGGPPSKGMYAVIRRGADNKPDTLIKGIREGIIRDAWLTQLDKSNLNELFIATRSTDSTASGNLVVYAVKNKNELAPVKYSAYLGDMMAANYHGRDTFYIRGTQVIREFPLYADGDAICCPSGGSIVIPYTLKGGELKEGKMEMKTNL